jgi:hypothetical protein
VAHHLLGDGQQREETIDATSGECDVGAAEHAVTQGRDVEANCVADADERRRGGGSRRRPGVDQSQGAAEAWVEPGAE